MTAAAPTRDEKPECARRLGVRRPWFKIGQLTDVFHCNLQHYLS
jgi:hypothetical protein